MGRMRRKLLISLVITFVLAGVVATLAGCGTDSTQEAYNTDVENLKTAVAGMTESSTYESIANFQVAVAEVQAAYDSVVTSAQAAGKKITDLQDAFGDLKAAIANVTSDQSLEQKVDAIKAAVEDLSNAIKAISPTGTVPGS